MDILDRMALWGRKYEQQKSLRTGDTRFDLGELLLRYNRNAILELTPITQSGPGLTARPDPVRKLKISLLDEGIASLGAEAGEWFEVYETAPSADFARVRIVGLVQNRPAGEIRMLIAQRNPDLYFKEDPIFGTLAARESA
jgi:hypothetical protein